MSTSNLKVSDRMHLELMFAANFFQNSRGVVAFCPKRTEEALYRRGLISGTSYGTLGNTPDYPVITVAGWNYLAAKGFRRRAEDPGRLTMHEALTEAYETTRKEI